MTDGPQRSHEPRRSDGEFSPGHGQQAAPHPGGAQPPADGQGYGYPPSQPGHGHPQQPQPGGYGYPAQQPEPAGYGYPPQGGQQQPGGPAQPDAPQPAWAPPAGHIGEGGLPRRAAGAAGEPDWSALADRSERDGRRRRLLLGGGALAVVVVAGIVATAVVVHDHHRPAVAQPSPTATDGLRQPSPTFSDVTPPPPPDPLTIISSAAKDTAPITAAGMFPGLGFDYQGRHYDRAAIDSSTACSALAGGPLHGVLAEYGCRRMVRATYDRDGIAVTVGVAVFDTPAQADRARDHAVSYVLPLGAAGLPTFCHATACQATSNAVGRYAYFTVAGRLGGARVSGTDPQTLRCAGDVAHLAFERIVQRGRDRAATATGGS